MKNLLLNLSKLGLILSIIFAAGCTESNTSKDQIEEASLKQIQGIENGLKDKSITIEKSCAVKSNDFENVYFVGAKLSNGEIAIWSIGGTKTETNIHMSVNDVATKYSDYPQNISRISMSDHGAKEVLEYLQLK